jgi:hypothetical protein
MLLPNRNVVNGKGSPNSNDFIFITEGLFRGL